MRDHEHALRSVASSCLRMSGYWTNVAANTQLPPSPELKGATIPLEPPQFSLGDQVSEQRVISRLRAIAKYDSFRPQALACSPLVTSFSEVESSSVIPGSPSKRSSATKPEGPSATSLGALAGSHGVAVFRVTKPHAPLLILSHASSASEAAVSCLEFHSSSSPLLYLAAARGAGVLVWDVSGHSLSPLWGRLGGMEVNGEAADMHVTSLAWQQGASSLVASTSNSVCLWDLREPTRSAFFRPTLRFGSGRKPSSLTANLQVACGGDECAVIDKTGIVRVYDIRMTERHTKSAGTLYSITSFRHAGVGLMHFPSSVASGNSWLSWGLDAPNESLVRIWTGGEAVDALSGSRDEYWYMDGSPTRSPEHSTSSKMTCRLIGQCTTPNLACARVCPAPLLDAFVTVGVDSRQKDEATLWHADLWTLSKSDVDYSIDKIISFRGGSRADEEPLSGFGHGIQLGTLCASELALTSQFKGTESTRETRQRLYLCSLTDKGYVTTHSIPEADIPQAALLSDWLPSPAHGGAAAQLRIFPAEQEGPVDDAARAWGKPKEPPKMTRSEVRPLSERKESLQSSGAPEGPTMPFDMDVPVAYSIAGVSDVPIGGMGGLLVGGPGPATASAVNETDQTKEDTARDAAMLMERIETDKIPCPRLCGASFGPGVGGLAIFSNGEVKKMWKWWEKTDPTALAAVPGLIGESSMTGRSSGHSMDDATSGVKILTARDCPRTLQDLADMTSAAKEAQWGEQEESDVSSSDLRATGANFFDDGSDGSSESGDDDSEDPADGSKDLYDSYFGSHQPLLDSPASVKDSEHKSDRRVSDRVAGPTSDMLAPAVRVSHQHDKLAMSEQCPELAKEWRLGRLGDDFDDLHTYEVTIAPADSIVRSPAALLEESPIAPRSPPSRVAGGLPSYRFLVPTPQKQNAKIPRVSSDPMLQTLSSKTSPTRKALGGVAADFEDERGVHGGEYSVRPNMQESMVFLRKLFTHQHEGTGNFPGNQFSPPDGPMLPISLSDPALGPTTMVQTLQTSGKENEERQVPRPMIGVYCLRRRDPDPNSTLAQELELAVDACLVNAKVCESLGQKGKQQTWELLAKAAEGQIALAFDEWSGLHGGALGPKLVAKILEYYESLGDVQMLSTIVCVLRLCSQLVESRQHRCLLPYGQDEKYDTYIWRYADLLYGWGLLTIRAELLKHLSRVMVESEVVPESNQENEPQPGIGMVFTCPRCCTESQRGINFCRSCQDFAFRCVICDNSVRGLFTCCESCGHGGHVDHLKEWFSSHVQCPTGCGCPCTLAAPDLVLAPVREATAESLLVHPTSVKVSLG